MKLSVEYTYKNIGLKNKILDIISNFCELTVRDSLNTVKKRLQRVKIKYITTEYINRST